MRVLCATPWYVPEGGGLERYAHHVMRRLAADGVDARVVAFTRDAPREEEMDGVRVTRVAPDLVLSNTPVAWRHPARLARLARDADVVVGHGPVPFAAECAALAARVARRPFVFTYHAGGLFANSRTLGLVARVHGATLERLAFRAASRIVTVSPLVADGYLGRWNGKVDVIPPGVDARAFTPGDDARRGAGILFVGSLSRAYRWKGFHVLYEAFREVRAAVPEARLVVVGDGDERPAWQARAARDGLGDAVDFRGRVSDAALAAAFREAGVVALPSTTAAESFGMVCAEANASGAPVVASRVGGVPAFVRDGENGLLVPPGDARALARALEALLTAPDKAREMGARGRERVLSEHDWDAIAARTRHVYADAIGRFGNG